MSLRALLCTALLAPSVASAFCETPGEDGRDPAEWCHPEMTRDALSFLRPGARDAVVDHVNDPDDYGFLNTSYASDDHFDHCNFDGGIDLINDRYTSALIEVSSFSAGGVVPTLGGGDVLLAMERWAWVLHASQDLYAHSNWVELGRNDLVDQGTGTWADIQTHAFDEPFVADIVATQSVTPTSGDDIYTLDADGAVLAVDQGDSSYRLLVSGRTDFSLTQSCPMGTLHHDDLHKDDSTRPAYEDAKTFAWQQTQHEWCRLLHLSDDDLGTAGPALLLGLLVEPGTDPHLQGTPCAPSGTADTAVTVTVTGLTTDPDHAGDPLNLALAAFSTDLTRSGRSAGQAGSIDSRGGVSGLPKPLTVCLEADQEAAVTLQGWVDTDGADTTLDPDDTVLDGVHLELGTAAELVASGPESLQQISDDLWLTVQVEASEGCVSRPTEPEQVEEEDDGTRSLGETTPALELKTR